MASTSVRVIAQTSKLQFRSPIFISARIHDVKSFQFPIISSVSSANSFRACLSSQRALLGSKRHHSTSTTTCTLSSSHSEVDLQARWISNQPSTCSPRSITRSNTIFPRRFASSQPSNSSKENEASPAPTTLEPSTNDPITAPSILQKALSQTTTKHENIYTLPNFLTFTRLLAAPAIGYFILTSQPVAALSLFFYAGITDLVDGYLARRFNSATVVGTIIDPMADKTLMTVSVICLSLEGLIPVWLAVIILGRDIGLAISATYYRYISLPPPKTFTRYWDFSLPSAEVRPTEISKINTLLQLLLVGNAMVLPVLPGSLVDAWNLIGVFEGWQFLVASTTVWSGLSYVFSNDAVKILSEEDAKAAEEKMKAERGEGKE